MARSQAHDLTPVDDRTHPSPIDGRVVGMDEVLRQAIADQAGMVARRQLVHGQVDWDRVRDNVSAGRWTVRSPRVVSTFTGELTREQREWLADLHAGPRSMLGGLTAAARHGLTGWERDVVTVYV